jgi:predicted lipoprotein with Yx(FWY)xxD motif
MTRARGLAVAALGALAAGCGGQPAPAPAPAPDRAAATSAKVTVVRSQFGRILADGRGQALYYFSREQGRASRCYGACAKAWPPVPSGGRPAAGRGTRAALVGITRRSDGTRQLTYAGHPVYLYVGDSPGRVLCHNVTEFGGVWRVIRSDGSPVR